MSKIYAPYSRPATVPETVTGQAFQRSLSLAIQSISNVEGNIWRYSFTSGSDISIWEHLATATFAGCLNPDNDGEFRIAVADLDVPYLDVENINGVAQAGPAGNLEIIIKGHSLHTDSIITAGKISVDALQGFNTKGYTVTTTPTVFPTIPLVGRKVLTAYNLSNTEIIYLGSSAVHTIADSIKIFPQDGWTFNLSDIAINTYFFTASGTASILIVEGS